MILVSVVVCSHNSVDTLGAALDSALNQTLRAEDFEVLLVDDGSTDSTADLAGEYRKQYPNLRYLRFPVSRGPSTALSNGLKAAQGRYLIRLGAEDAFHREILESCAQPLETDQTDLVYCDMYDVMLDQGTHNLVEADTFDPSVFGTFGVMLRVDLMLEVAGTREPPWDRPELYLRYLNRSGRLPERVPRPLYYRTSPPEGPTAHGSQVA